MIRSCSFLLVFASVALGQDSNALQEKVIRAAVAKVAPTIVMIETSGGQDVIVGGGIRKVAGPTTGMVVSEDGLVMTSTFNFANSPSDIFITYPGKGRYVAKAVGMDMTRMLTLLKPQGENPPKGLPVPVPVPRKEIAIGQWAIACGRTIDNNIEHTPSMSSGIISALNRVWGKAVQTDAARERLGRGFRRVHFHQSENRCRPSRAIHEARRSGPRRWGARSLRSR